MTRFIALTLMIFGLALPAQSQSYPDHVTTTVNDFAGLLDSDTAARITATLTALKSDKDIELTVVTVPRRGDFGDHGSIEAFATGLFNDWGIGNADRNDGIMILVAAEDREMRLELGSGYPATYDWLARDVVQNVMIPKFRDGRMAEGIEAGVNAAILRIAIPFAEGRPPETRPDTVNATGQGWSNDSGAPASDGSSMLGWFLGLLGAGIGALFLKGPISDALLRRRPCPQCGQKGLSRQRETISAATRSSTGLLRNTITCSFCSYRDVQDRVTPRITRSKSSSSGGSFGGGSSSGGGASGRW